MTFQQYVARMDRIVRCARAAKYVSAAAAIGLAATSWHGWALASGSRVALAWCCYGVLILAIVVDHTASRRLLRTMREFMLQEPPP